MSSPIADSYTEFFVGYTISYIVDGKKYRVNRKETPGKGNVLYIYTTGTYELDFDISDELRPIGEYDGTIPNHVYMSTDNVVWDFGDGTKATGLNVTHKYTEPGEYTVLVTLRDYDGRSKVSKYRQTIHVADFVKSEVKWETVNMIERRCDTAPAGAPSDNLTIKTSTSNRYNNIQRSVDEEMLHTVSLYVSGSNSQPAQADDYENYKYAQFDRLCRFISADDLSPINHVDIKPSTVYIRPTLKEMEDNTWDITYNYYIDPEIIPTDLTDEERSHYMNENDYYNHVYDTITDRNNNTNWKYEIAGHVGRENIRYLDDTCKVYLSRQQDPVFLFASLQISETLMIDPVVNLEKEPVLAIEDWNVDALPIKILFNPATALSITPTGTQQILYPVNKYQNSKIALNIALVDDVRASILKSDPYPPLKFEGEPTIWNYYHFPEPPGFFAPRWELTPVGGTPVSLGLERGINETIPVTTYGSTNQYIVPETENGSYQLSATCVVRDLPYCPKEVESYFVTNMHTDRIFAIRPGYMDKIYTFEPEYTLNVRDFLTSVYAQMEEPLEVIARVSDDALTHYFSIGVTSNNDAWIADSDLDAIIKVSRFGEHLDTIILPQDFGIDEQPPVLSGDIETNVKSPITHPGIGQTLTESNVAFSIASISINSNDDIWVAASEPPYLLKYDALPPGQLERKSPLIVPIILEDENLDPDRLQIQKIETDREDNVWVTLLYGRSQPDPQSDPASENEKFYLTKYSATGERLIDPIEFPEFVHLHDLHVDGFNNLWVTNIAPTRGDDSYGSLYHFSATGELLKEMKSYIDPITGHEKYFDKPAQLAMDMSDNVWMVHRGNELIRIATDTRGEVPMYTVTLTTTAGPKWNDPPAAIELHGRRHAIEGLSCDSDNRILAINNVSKKLYMFDALDESRHTWDPFELGDTTEDRKYNERPLPLDSDKVYHQPNSYHILQAFGDWTGIKWIQKYAKYPNTTRTIYGLSNTFKIIEDIPSIQKVNENHGYSDTIDSMTLQPTVGNSSNFIDKIIQPAAGGINEPPETLGKCTYEKTANFTLNVSDVDTTNVTQFYSLCEQLGYDIKDLNYLSPASIKRLIDLFSINYSKLIGSRDQTENTFNALGQQPSINLGKNLGDLIDFENYIVIAGVPIVARELFNNKYRYIKPMTIRGSSGDEHLSTYNLRDYHSDWGWRLSTPNDEPVNHYYDFYKFKPNVERSSKHTSNQINADISQDLTVESPYMYSEHRQVEGVIDWENPMTTLLETQTTLESLYNPTDNTHIGRQDKESYMEIIIERKIRQGLELDPKDLPWMEPEQQLIANPPEPIPYDDPNS